MIIIDDKTTPPSYNLYDPADEALYPPPYDASVSRALTTHEYSIKPKPHTEITLTLDSHSPAPDKLPLYYPPDQIGGKVKLRLERTFGFRSITVSVRFPAHYVDSVAPMGLTCMDSAARGSSEQLGDHPRSVEAQSLTMAVIVCVSSVSFGFKCLHQANPESLPCFIRRHSVFHSLIGHHLPVLPPSRRAKEQHISCLAPLTGPSSWTFPTHTLRRRKVVGVGRRISSVRRMW